MANPEHVAILKQGVEVWNEWRKELQWKKPNLSRANLSGADLDLIDLDQTFLISTDLSRAKLNGASLSGADLDHALLIGTYLTEANLTGANLTRADLGGANLSGANLRGTNLSGADLDQALLIGTYLTGANLTGANLRDADLRRANLSRADLSKSDLSRANLSKANLIEAAFWETALGNTDFSGAENLDFCKHLGPSTIDHRTLANNLNLPLTFLRGVGLSDLEIEVAELYQQGLNDTQIADITYRIHDLRASQPFNFYSCFISYSTQDETFAQCLHADLQDSGVRCWFAPEDIKGGRKLHEQITGAIRLHDKLLLLLSPHSMNSPWVETEIKSARKRERLEDRQVLFPLRLCSFDALQSWELFDADEGRDLAAEVRSYFIPDFSQWQDHASYQPAFERLLRDLRAEGKPG